MSNAKPVTVSILEKEYHVACEDGQKEMLYETVKFLNARMQQLRENGRIVGSERIAVMTALNIAHEYLEYRGKRENVTSGIDDDIKRIHDKIIAALTVERRSEGELKV